MRRLAFGTDSENNTSILSRFSFLLSLLSRQRKNTSKHVFLFPFCADVTTDSVENWSREYFSCECLKQLKLNFFLYCGGELEENCSSQPTNFARQE
jgi:hypothetical protein